MKLNEIEAEIKFEGNSHSAFSMGEYFVGYEIYSCNGKKLIWKFKIVCPSCEASGNNLKHANWYESKNMDTDLVIECIDCGSNVNCETKSFDDWKVGK